MYIKNQYICKCNLRSKYYPEFDDYEVNCKFQGCSHISEPVCGIKEALAEGKISPLRYENYKLLYDELKDVKKY